MPVIETIPYNELIGNLKADIFQFNFDDAAGAPVQQRTDFERLRISAGQRAEKIFQRETGIDDVFDYKNLIWKYGLNNGEENNGNGDDKMKIEKSLMDND